MGSDRLTGMPLNQLQKVSFTIGNCFLGEWYGTQRPLVTQFNYYL